MLVTFDFTYFEYSLILFYSASDLDIVKIAIGHSILKLVKVVNKYPTRLALSSVWRVPVKLIAAMIQ